MGEAVLKHVAKERGLDITVDSAGTAAYHIGEDPDDRLFHSYPYRFLFLMACSRTVSTCRQVPDIGDYFEIYLTYSMIAIVILAQSTHKSSSTSSDCK